MNHLRGLRILSAINERGSGVVDCMVASKQAKQAAERIAVSRVLLLDHYNCR